MADYTLSLTAAEIDAALEAAQNSAAIVGILVGNGDGTFTFRNVDATPVSNSSNLITSGAVKAGLDSKQATLTFDAVPTGMSNNPVKSGGIYDALANKQNIVTYTDDGDGNIVIS